METTKRKREQHRRSKRDGTYRSWLKMKDRCLDERNNRYHSHGGRGISVCDRWKNSFLAFLADMGERPDGMSIERKDNNGPYCKDNCIWATDKQQARNRRNNLLVTRNGETKTLAELAEELGIKYKRLWKHFRYYGKPLEQAIADASRPDVRCT